MERPVLVASIGYERQGITDLLKQVPKGETDQRNSVLYPHLEREDASGNQFPVRRHLAKEWVETNQGGIILAGRILASIMENWSNT